MPYIDRDKVFNKADILTVHTREYGSIEAIPVEYLADLPIEDVVPRNDVKELSDNNERLRAEVEKLEKKLNDYKKFVGEIRVTSENHAVIIDTEHTEYIDKRVAEGLKNMAVHKAKQEVAREIFEEIFALCNNAKEKLDVLFTEKNEYRKGYENSVNHFIENMEKLRKKYIGE